MIEILFVKSSLILVAATLATILMRRRSAAARHLVWLCSLVALLILPLGTLLPRSVVTVPQIAVSFVESTATRDADNSRFWHVLLHALARWRTL